MASNYLDREQNINRTEGYSPTFPWIPKKKNTSTYYSYLVDSQATIPLRALHRRENETDR